MEASKQTMSFSPRNFMEPLGHEMESFWASISVDAACLGICVLVLSFFKLRAKSRKQSSSEPKAFKTAEKKAAKDPNNSAQNDAPFGLHHAEKTTPKKQEASILQEILACNDRHRGRALDLYLKHRKRIKWSLLEPSEAEKVFFNFCMAAARQGEMSILEMLLQDMEEAGVARTQDLYSNVCKMITSKRMFDEALVLWRWMRKDQVEVDRSITSCLLFAATQSKDNDLALHFFEQLRQTNSALSADYGNACRVLVSTSRPVEAALLVREMHEKSIEPYRVTYQMVFSACCAEGRQLDLAQEMLGPMRKMEGLCDSVMYNVLIKGHVQANRFNDALNWLAVMKEDNVAPSSITFGILLDACIDKCKMDIASLVFRQMINSGLEMNAVLFTTMMKGLAKAGRVKDALDLYEHMIQQGIEPDLFTYSTLIKCLCDNKELESAFLLLDQMSTKGISPDEVIFNNLLAGCVQCSNLSLGERLLQDMINLGIKPSVTSVSILLKLHSKCQSLPKALELLQTMEARFGVKAEQRLYVQLINTCLSIRKGALALEAFAEMRDLFGLPGEADVAKFIRLGVQFKLLEESLKIAQVALKDGVKLASGDLNSIHDVAMKSQHKSVLHAVAELAQRFRIQLR
jgi:pentatricopeptide repeat protein